MTAVAGRLHGPEFPAAGVPAQLSFQGEQLRVVLDGGVFEDLPVDLLAVEVTGFNEDTLQLSWEAHGHTHAVTITGREAQRTLLSQAPEKMTGQLRRGRFTMNWHRRKWNIVIGVLASFVLLLIVGWWQSEAITGWIAGRVSPETETRIGERALAQLEDEYALTREGPAATTLANLGARLTQGSRYQYRWYVSNDRDVNAFALPGGIIVVNAGLIEAAENAEQLAGVLAHEVQHVEQRHTLQQMIHTAGWAAILAVVLGDVSAITAIVVHQLGNLRNSRKLESQADSEGIKALVRAGIQPGGLVDLFRKLEGQQRRRGGEGITLLMSHPATGERIADLEQLAASMPCDCRPLELDWPAVQSSAREWRAAN